MWKLYADRIYIYIYYITLLRRIRNASKYKSPNHPLYYSSTMYYFSSRIILRTYNNPLCVRVSWTYFMRIKYVHIRRRRAALRFSTVLYYIRWPTIITIIYITHDRPEEREQNVSLLYYTAEPPPKTRVLWRYVCVLKVYRYITRRLTIGRERERKQYVIIIHIYII